MVAINEYRDKSIGVVGLGKTGLSVTYALLAGGAKVFAWDDSLDLIKSLQPSSDNNSTQSIEKLLLAQALLNGTLILNPDLSKIKLLNAIMVSPGIAINNSKHPVVQECLLHNIHMLSDISMLIEACPHATHIAITGTNGKSTTTALLGHILKLNNKMVKVGGNIGTPVLSLQALDQGGFYVIETSSFQLERSSKARFNTAILLNITPDHMDRYATIEEYIQAKLQIFANQTSSDFSIICVDCPISNQAYLTLKQNSPATVIPFSTQNKLDYGISLLQNVIYISLGDINRAYPLGELKNLTGNHNMQNLAAAFTAALVNGLDPEAVINSIHFFEGLRHRMQLVCEKNGLKFINDSKATNADSCVKALETFDNIYWIAGGICKDDGIENLNHTFHKIKHAYLVGNAAEGFASILSKYNIPHTISNTLQESFALLSEIRPAHGVVLLSPACASFDQWRNFEERGDAFCNLALEWK